MLPLAIKKKTTEVAPYEGFQGTSIPQGENFRVDPELTVGMNIFRAT